MAAAAGSVALLTWGSGVWYWIGLFVLVVVVFGALGIGKVPRRELEVPGAGEGLDVLLIEVGENDLDILKLYGQFSELEFEQMDSLIEDGQLPAPMGVSLTQRDAEEFVSLISRHGGKAEIIWKRRDR